MNLLLKSNSYKKLHEYTGDTIKLTDAIQQNVGNNFAEIFSQIYQTVLITKGKFININDLDSIYEQELKNRSYKRNMYSYFTITKDVASPFQETPYNLQEIPIS